LALLAPFARYAARAEDILDAVEDTERVTRGGELRCFATAITGCSSVSLMFSFSSILLGATRGLDSEDAVGARYEGVTAELVRTGPDATRWNDLADADAVLLSVSTEYALSERERDILDRGEPERRSPPGLCGMSSSGGGSGCNGASCGVGGDE